jgi:hypothetical protein
MRRLPSFPKAVKSPRTIAAFGYAAAAAVGDPHCWCPTANQNYSACKSRVFVMTFVTSCENKNVHHQEGGLRENRAQEAQRRRLVTLLVLLVQSRFDEREHRIPLKFNGLRQDCSHQSQPRNFVHKGVTGVSPTFSKMHSCNGLCKLRACRTTISHPIRDTFGTLGGTTAGAFPLIDLDARQACPARPTDVPHEFRRAAASRKLLQIYLASWTAPGASGCHSWFRRCRLQAPVAFDQLLTPFVLILTA